VGAGLRKREGRGVRAAAGLERGVWAASTGLAGGKKCGLGQGKQICGLSAEENWAKIERVGFSCFGFGLGLVGVLGCLGFFLFFSLVFLSFSFFKLTQTNLNSKPYALKQSKPCTSMNAQTSLNLK
jgi:hypothetical protein